MYHVLFVICIYIPISCNAFGIKHYYFLVETNLCRFLKLFVYICIVIGDTIKSNKGGGGVGIPVIGLIPSHVCACPKPNPRYFSPQWFM